MIVLGYPLRSPKIPRCLRQPPQSIIYDASQKRQKTGKTTRGTSRKTKTAHGRTCRHRWAQAREWPEEAAEKGEGCDKAGKGKGTGGETGGESKGAEIGVVIRVYHRCGYGLCEMK